VGDEEFDRPVIVTETTTPSPAVGRSSRRRLYWVAAAVLLAASILGWHFRERGKSEASVIVLPSDHAIQAMSAPALDRLIPARWGWLWNLPYAVFGKPRSVEVEHTFFQLSPDAEVAEPTVMFGPALVASNGVSAWTMDLDDAKDLKARFKQQSGVASRVGWVSLGAGVVATITSSSGTVTAGSPVPAGTSATYAVRPRGEGIEIRAAFVSWGIETNSNDGVLKESPVFAHDTNLTMAVSMFVPHGKAVYLRSERENGTRQSSAAVLILPSIK